MGEREFMVFVQVENGGISCGFTCVGESISRHFAALLKGKGHGGSNGPLAAIDSEPRQARKGATVVIDSGAEVWLFESPPNNRRAHYELSSSCTKVATV